jgi:hypothetical protein
MPKGIDWMNFVYVNLAFVAQIAALYYFTTLTDIKNNWPKYRCNPMFMPLSDNIEKDFTYCVQNMQTNFMGYLLQPLTYITSNLSTMGGEFTDSINFIRVMLSNIRTFITSIIESIMGVFLNLITEFQKITISIKDLIGKLIGVMVTIMYIMDGSIKTMQSTWNGPPGQMVRNLGHCFHPKTLVKLQNGEKKYMKDVRLGDVLENGAVVNATMKVENKIKGEELMVFEGAGVDGEDIYVTGSHYVLNDVTESYVKVCNYSSAKTQVKKRTKWFSCLITSDHTISVGKHVFWDWEDWRLPLNH